jgi:PAS domain S-box-containing protein
MVFQNFPVLTSIRSKLIGILVVLGVLPLLVMGFLSYQSATEALLVQSQEQLGNLAEKTSQQVDSFFQDIQKDISLLADFSFIQMAFLQYEFNQRLDTVQRLLEDYQQKNPYFNHIYLISLEGNPILTVPDDPTSHKQSFASSKWFMSTLEKKTYAADIDADNSRVYIGKLVFDFEDSTKPVGVLTFDIKKSAFSNYLASLRIGRRGYAFLLHQDGRIIYHPDPQMMSHPGYLTRNGDERLKKQIRQMMSGEKGFGGYTLDGIEKFVIYTPCKNKPWSVGITVFKSELMANINNLRSRLETFFLCVVLLIIPVSFWFIKSLTLPIRQLITGAGAIGNGDLDQTIQIASNDELQAVAEEFNKMAARLKSTMGDIIELQVFHEDILRNVSSGIITVDRQARITSINQSAQKILSFNRPNFPIAADELPQHVRQILDQLKTVLSAEPKIEHYELTIQKPGQEPAVLEINASLLDNQCGKIFGAIADIRDITQRKRIEQGMLRVEKLASLGELSAGMAHEIRNPLAGIKTSVQVLARKIKSPHEETLLDGILFEINRLDKIVTDLLRFSRPSIPVPSATDLASVLENIFDLLQEKFKKQGIQLERRYEQATHLVKVDREQIRQVFLNLLLNSIKAMAHGGRIIIEFNQRLDHNSATGYLEVIFADTGIGISKENLTKIFVPFFTTDPKGTGLGLSIVHKLLEENNGYIFADSVLGEGTRMTIGLPVWQETEY